MKVCLLGDTHFGVRNDSKHFHEYYEKFYSQTLFPYLRENGIDTIIQLGDLFDRRKYINFLSLSESRRYFFDPLKEYGMKMHVLIGNHDIFWKESLNVNSPDLLLRGYDNITLWNHPGTLMLDNCGIDMIPWVCKENEEEVAKFVEQSSRRICMGHFEFAGFLVTRGLMYEDGADHRRYKDYDLVFSGHFHLKSESDNIRYVGTPYELFWSDYKEQKGFHILDTETLKIEYIQNPHRMFYKFRYDDLKNIDYNQIKSLEKHYKSSYIKVIVVNKKDPIKFDLVIEELHKLNPADLTIVEDFNDEFENELNQDLIDQAEDTMTILSKYIDAQNLNLDSNKLKGIMRELYVEALSSDTAE